MEDFKKGICLIMGIFFLVILFSSPIWATEDGFENNTLIESKILDIPGNCEEFVCESNGENVSYSSLNNQINANTIVELDNDYTYNSSTDSRLNGGIPIKKSVVIDGKGHTINSTAEAKLFDINSFGDLTLKNIILLNYNPESCSGINNGGKLTFDNVTFITQKEVSGSTLNAAIVNTGDFTVINSNFKDSLINCTGNSLIYVYGLLIRNSGNLILENTNITNCGIVARTSTVQIHGGLIYNSRNLFLNKVNMSGSFIKVKASASTIFGYILGISNNSNVLVNNSFFENNIIINNATTNSAMTNVLRIANGNLNVYNSHFINNTGSLDAGAIGYYAQNEMIVENSLFESNAATIQGGAIFTSGNMKSNNNTFRNNFAGRNGGAIYIYGYYDTGNPDLGNFISTNDLYEYNWVESSPDAYGQASILSWGGAICSKAGNVYLENDTFYRNKALMGDGGAIANYLSSWLQVTHCIFKENEATRWDIWTHASGLGGAILIPQTEMVDEDNLATFNIEYSIFDKNIGIAGSALYSVPYQDIPCDFTSNNNYWGSNNPFFKELIGKYQLSDVVFPDNFIIMDIEMDEPVYVRSSNEFKLALNKVNENGIIKELDGCLPSYEFNITSVLNSLPTNSLIVENGEAGFTYDAANIGLERFSINNNLFKKEFSVVKYDSKLNLTYVPSDDSTLFELLVSPDLSGNISIRFDNEVYNSSNQNGNVLIKLPKFNKGVNCITIFYDGDGRYNAFSIDKNITVEKYVPTIDISVPDNVNNHIVSIRFSSSATGRVLFDVGGKNVYSNIKNGVASLDISSLSNVKKIVWRYLGDENYTEMAGIIVIPYQSKIINNKNVIAFYTDGLLYKVRILENGKVVGKGKVVLFKINGKTISAKTDKNGYASFKITQTPKKYTVVTQYGDVKVKNSITVKKVLFAKNVSKKKAKKVKYTATVKGKKAFKGKKVTFKVNGKKYAAKTNKKGVATVYLKNLKVGKHKIVVIYAKTKVTKSIKIKK